MAPPFGVELTSFPRGWPSKWPCFARICATRFADPRAREPVVRRVNDRPHGVRGISRGARARRPLRDVSDGAARDSGRPDHCSASGVKPSSLSWVGAMSRDAGIAATVQELFDRYATAADLRALDAGVCHKPLSIEEIQGVARALLTHRRSAPTPVQRARGDVQLLSRVQRAKHIRERPRRRQAVGLPQSPRPATAERRRSTPPTGTNPSIL